MSKHWEISSGCLICIKGCMVLKSWKYDKGKRTKIFVTFGNGKHNVNSCLSETRKLANFSLN